MSRAALVLASLLVVVAAGACQPLDPFVPAQPYCDEQVMDLASVDAANPDGVRVADFIDRVTGPRTMVAYDYQPPPGDESVYVDIGPVDPMTTVDLELSPALDQIRWVEAEVVYPEGSDTSEEIYCQSRFELGASLSFTTADGVFAELFETTILAFVDDAGALESVGVPVAFDPDALAGSFEVVSIEPPGPAPSFVFFEVWVEYPLAGDPATPAQPRGYVGGVAEYDLIDYYAIGVFHIALFGGYSLD